MGRGARLNKAVSAGVASLRSSTRSRSTKLETSLSKQAVVPTKSIDFNYILDFDDDGTMECKKTINCEDSCRCLTLTNARVEKTPSSWLIADQLLYAYSKQAQNLSQQPDRSNEPHPSDQPQSFSAFDEAMNRRLGRAPACEITPTDRAGIEWIVRAQHLSANDFEVNVRSGYEGEEIESIRLEDGGRIQALAQKYLELPQNAKERLTWLFANEHGYLPPALVNAREVAIKEVSPSDVQLPASHGEAPSDTAYARRVEDYQDEPEQSESAPVAVIAEHDGVMEVLEGGGRLTAMRDHDSVSVWIVRP